MKNRSKTYQIIQAQKMMSSIQDRIVKAIGEGATMEYNINFEIRQKQRTQFSSFVEHEPTGGFSVTIDLIK